MKIRTIFNALPPKALACGLAFACLGLPLAAPLAAQEAQALSVSDTQLLATQALLAGDLPLAAELAQALITRDPADPVGRGVLARIALMQGNPAAARDQAVALWSASDDPAVRYDAARLAAFAWVELDRPFLGQFWLRRALTVAPDAEAEARTNADARALREPNPLSVNLSFSLNPSSNVTGGTSVNTISVNGDPLEIPAGWLPFFGNTPITLSPSPIDRSYGGLAYAPGLSVSYRLHQDDDSRTNLWTRLQYRGVILSDAAERALEGETYNREQITARHFSFGQALAGIDHVMRFDRADLALSLHGGRSWQRGDPAEDIGSISATYTYFTGNYAATSAGLTREWRFDTEGLSPVQIRDSLRLNHIQMLDNGTRLRLSLGATQARSANARSDFDRMSFDFALRPRDWVEGITLEARASYQWTHYPDYAFFSAIDGGRKDERVALALDIQLPRYSYAGFSPVVSFEAGQTFSNINQFASDDVNFNLGFESTF